jgi:hypothetical protein
MFVNVAFLVRKTRLPSSMSASPVFPLQEKCGLRKGLYPSGFKSPGSTSGPGFDSLWERISQDLTTFVLSVADDVPVYSDASVVTLSILRIWRHSLRRCS